MYSHKQAKLYVVRKSALTTQQLSSDGHDDVFCVRFLSLYVNARAHNKRKDLLLLASAAATAHNMREREGGLPLSSSWQLLLRCSLCVEAIHKEPWTTNVAAAEEGGNS